MKAIIPGHKYELENFQTPGVAAVPPQRIQFVEKDHITGWPIPGTTNEEVIRMLIDRITHLNNAFPSRGSALAVTKLEEALHWLNYRTAERRARGVEGQHLP